ncbi:hypothetical protein B0H16DRAFT_1544564 [Mycena metata]|uniref:Uncharacterized protein n=1 Tax=Mycena metata TaxID=1033252 RepID=A0AAD7IZ10_9AGAR|nr:hypothetical protein B0H16DRAFT_1544564 [Mycena metata]
MPRTRHISYLSTTDSRLQARALRRIPRWISICGSSFDASTACASQHACRPGQFPISQHIHFAPQPFLPPTTLLPSTTFLSFTSLFHFWCTATRHPAPAPRSLNPTARRETQPSGNDTRAARTSCTAMLQSQQRPQWFNPSLFAGRWTRQQSTGK